MTIFTFSVLTTNILFGQFCFKNSKLFKLKFDSKTNSNGQNSMVVFILSILDWEYRFGGNLVQKIKIASLCWELVLRFIRIWRIQWRCSFSVFGWKYLLKFFFSKIKIACWTCNLKPRLIWICRIRWWFFGVFYWKYPFWVNLVQKYKGASLKQDLVPRLIWICKLMTMDFHFFYYIASCKFFPKNQFGVLILPD